MKTKNQNKTITQTNPTVDRESVRMLAIELGAREAARRLGIKESTVLSWAKRNHWKLPRRKGGGTGKNAITLAIKPGDALIAAHEELEDTTKTALMQTLSKAAQKVATKEALDVSNTAQLRDICLAAARMFGWDGDGKATVTVNADKAVIVCDEGRQRELIAQRQRLLGEKQATGRTIEEAVPATLAKEQTQSNANVSAGNGTVAQDQEPTVQQSPLSQRWESIGRADTWKTGKGSEPAVVTDFMPWPEEYQ